MNFDDTLREKTAHAENVIMEYLPAPRGYAGIMMEAMEYSMMAGGKRLRPVLMRETFIESGGRGGLIEPFMAAMEMIHTHSLIHDDLPALDADRYRRGKETTWVRYGEPAALLAGDGLLNLAYETALQSFRLCDASALQYGRIAKALNILAEKTGWKGMLGGQSADVLTPPAKLGEEELSYIYDLKTGALIEASLMIGAILGGASEDDVSSLQKAGHMIGNAFQIRDDVLDVTGSLEKLGKPTGSDEKNGTPRAAVRY